MFKLYYFDIYQGLVIQIKLLYIYLNNGIIKIMKNIIMPKSLMEDLKQLGLIVTVNHTAGELRIGNVLFQSKAHPQYFDSLSPNAGIILRDSTQELRRYLEARQINYIDRYGNLSIITNELNLKIQKIKQKRKKESNLQLALPPTLLVSPNGLSIVDTLFRLNEVELKKFQSGLQFCKSFLLNQPKLSKIMTTLKANNLIELKKKIQKIPIEWWMYSFDNPIIKRKMISFFDIAQDYYSHDPKVELLTKEEILKEIHQNYKNQACEGPTVVASALSELVDDEISLWISPIEQTKFKKEFKLIPGRKESSRTWKIAVTPINIAKMGLRTHVQNEKLPSANLIRAIWDLSYSDSRSREVRVNLLRNFLK